MKAKKPTPPGLKDEYEKDDNVTVAELAAKYGVDRGVIKRMLRELGVTIRPRSYAATKRLSPERAAELQKRYDNGESVKAIADDTRLSVAKVYENITCKKPGSPIGYRNDALKLFSEETRQEAVRLYQDEKLNAKEVAERMNLSGDLSAEMTPVHVARIIEMARVPSHPQSVTQHRDRTPIPGLDREYVKDGLSLAELGAKYRRHPSTIRAILTDMGVTIRPAGRKP